MSETPTPETDGLEAHKDEAVCRLVVPSIFSRRLERERDEARRELKRLKKELVSANRGAEINAKVNQSIAKKLHDLEGYAARTRDHLLACSTMHLETMNERDDALKEWDLARDGWSKALKERDEARRERDEFRKNSLALVEELKKSVIRLAKERDEARRELAELKTELARVSQMDQHADKSSVGDSTYVLTQQPCQRASRVGVDPDWTAIGNETTETAEGNRSL